MNDFHPQSRIKRELKSTRYQVGIYSRMLTALRRGSPDFLIAGAQKAGTTTLYALVTQHPNILPVYRNKEIHYWDIQQNYRKGLLWYRAHFPLIRELKAASAITGEKTPNYLESPEYIRKIKQDFPAMKMIILLRNPVERAISNYYMIHRNGAEELSLMNALLDEDNRLASPGERKKYGTLRAYKLRGIYAPSIKVCMELFPPAQILILESNDLFSNPSMVVDKACSLLGVSSSLMPEIKLHKNIGAYEKDKIPQEVYEYLQEYYRPHNEELFALLGREFGW